MLWRFTIALSIAAAGCGRFDFQAVSDGGGGGGGGDGSVAAMNVVFATSDLYDGNLGGLAGADAICQQHATAGGLAGTYVAWLSTSTVDAANRLVMPGTSTPARGWVRPDGLPVVDTVADLVAGTIVHPIRLDERGADLATADHDVNTGTSPNGTFDAGEAQCEDWTAAMATEMYTNGDVARTTSYWTSIGTNNCANNNGRLFCFQVDHATPLVITPATGRIAFVSDEGFAANSGAMAADVICQNEASAAGLPGGYLALLSTQAQPAAARFSVAKPTWVRRDGVELAATAADALSFTIDAPLNVDASGAYIGPGGSVQDHTWTGSTSPGAAAAAATDDCSDWSLASASMVGDQGAIESTTVGWNQSQDTCDGVFRVYCFEQ